MGVRRCPGLPAPSHRYLAVTPGALVWQVARLERWSLPAVTGGKAYRASSRHWWGRGARALGCPLASRLHLKAGGLWQAPHDVLWVLQSSSVTQGPRGPSGGSRGTGRQPWPGSCHPEPCDFGQLATSAPRQQNGKSP